MADDMVPDAMATARPRPRLLRLIATLAVAGVLITVMVLGPAPSLWTLRGTLAGSTDAAAWTHVPSGQPLVLACDVPGLLESPVARELRPALEDLAARHGFDTGLVEANVRLLIVSADAPEQGFAVASGFRLSPLLLARFAKPWVVVPFHGAPAATDGATLLAPLEPGIVAWIPAGVDPAGVAASLDAAQLSSAEPLALEGSALRASLTLDDRLRARALRELPREASSLVASLTHVDARITPSEELGLRVMLTHRDEASATATAALLTQANTAAVLMRGAGSFAALLGPDAALLALVPPLTISREGSLVHVEASASAELVAKWLAEAEQRLTK